MDFYALQSSPPPVGIDPFVWLVWIAVTGAVGKLYWDSRAESKRKDELIDRLLAQAERATDTTEKSVNHAERERMRSRASP